MKRYPARRLAFATVLRDARVRAGLSQRRLSAILGEPHNYAHMIESGRQAVTLERLFAWSEACGARPSALVRKAEELLRAHRMPVPRARPK